MFKYYFVIVLITSVLGTPPIVPDDDNYTPAPIPDIECSSDTDCNKHGSYIINHTRCDIRSNRCTCMSGFEVSTNKTMCLKVASPGDMHCEDNVQCNFPQGHHNLLHCEHGQCVCPHSYKWDSSEENCIMQTPIPNIECRSDTDCNKHEQHTRCNSTSSRCTCVTGFVISTNKTMCLKGAGAVTKSNVILLLSVIISAIVKQLSRI